VSNLENQCKAINLNGVGESIILSSIQREQTRRQDQSNRGDVQSDFFNKQSSSTLSADEILLSLRERIKGRNSMSGNR
jgi:hypothetical protein